MCAALVAIRTCVGVVVVGFRAGVAGVVVVWAGVVVVWAGVVGVVGVGVVWAGVGPISIGKGQPAPMHSRLEASKPSSTQVLIILMHATKRMQSW